MATGNPAGGGGGVVIQPFYRRWGGFGAASAIELRQRADLAHVPVGVGVSEQRALEVLATEPGAVVTEVRRRCVHRVVRIHDVGFTVTISVAGPARPGAGHELHRAQRAGTRRADVDAVPALDLADRGQDLPGQAG